MIRRGSDEEEGRRRLEVRKIIRGRRVTSMSHDDERWDEEEDYVDVVWEQR